MKKFYAISLLALLAFATSCQKDTEVINGDINVGLQSGEAYVYGFDLYDNQSEVLTIAAPLHDTESSVRRGANNEIEFYYKSDANYTGEDYAEFNICDRSGSSSCRTSTMRIFFTITP